MKKLENKVAIVTGAASGMGKAIALLYAREGASVVVADVNGEGALLVAQEIWAFGGKATAVTSDVAKEADVRQMINTSLEHYGTLDILVNNAGIMDNFVPVEALTDDLWERVLSINITGPMRAIRRAMSIFKQKGSGNIINIASIGGLQGSRAGAAYTSSKHALIGLTKNVAFQYANFGVRCNVIAPGGVDTNIGATINAPDAFGMERAMAGISTNPRSGSSDEIASIALFLASADSSFVNGAVIVADGGWLAY